MGGGGGGGGEDQLLLTIVGHSMFYAISTIIECFLLGGVGALV